MWVNYQACTGMGIVGRRMRVSGTAENYNEATNVYDHRCVRLPGGLVGFCEMLVPDGVKLTVRRQDNQLLWRRISGLSNENINAGTLVCYMSVTRLIGMEVEVKD
jgi:hypothetical protein